jgi:hypothetical protein
MCVVVDVTLTLREEERKRIQAAEDEVRKKEDEHKKMLQDLSDSLPPEPAPGTPGLFAYPVPYEMCVCVCVFVHSSLLAFRKREENICARMCARTLHTLLGSVLFAAPVCLSPLQRMVV